MSGVASSRTRRGADVPLRARLGACVGVRISLGVALVGVLLSPAVAHAYSTEVLRSQGEAANRVQLVVLGDGYTSAQTAKLRADAIAMLDGLFAAQPYTDYETYFDATLIYVTSVESGADHPAQSTYRNTALDAAYDCNGIDRLICIDTTTTLSVAANHVPNFDMALVLVNDTVYGGSGGTAPVTSLHTDSIEILRHEFAHPFGNLADEHEAPYPSYPACNAVSDCAEPNVTLRTNRADIKWNDWIAQSTPVPTPETGTYADDIGIFEGARYQTTGLYRPALDCKMNHLDVEFCAVCGEALIESIYGFVSPIDAHSPTQPVTLGPGAQRTLQVFTPQTASSTVVVRWRVDGVLQGGPGSPTYVARSADLGVGAHTIIAEVEDTTTRLRDPAQGLVDATVNFAVEVTSATTASCGNNLPDPGEACDDGVLDGSYGGCNDDCTLGPRCGDGALQASDEACDLPSGNVGGYGGCASDCTLGPHCGDDVIDAGYEVCDDGDQNLGLYGGCTNLCTRAGFCGDNVQNGPESCDGSAPAGYLCTSTCRYQRIVEGPSGPSGASTDAPADPGGGCDCRGASGEFGGAGIALAVLALCRARRRRGAAA